MIEEREIILVVSRPFDEDWEPGDILKFRRPRDRHMYSGSNPFGSGRLSVSLSDPTYDPEHWRVLGFFHSDYGRTIGATRPGLAVLRSLEPISIVA